MKQLLKHYAEVKSLVDKGLGYLQDPKHSVIATGGQISYSISTHKYWVMLAQREQLELEELLYGYWERNVFSKMDLGKNKLDSVWRFSSFNDWLEEQLEKSEE